MSRAQKSTGEIATIHNAAQAVIDAVATARAAGVVLPGTLDGYVSLMNRGASLVVKTLTSPAVAESQPEA